MWVGFCLKTGKCLFVGDSFWSQKKEHRFLYKTVVGTFKIALDLRDQHIFMWQSQEIFIVFNMLTLYHFLLKVLWLKMQHFHTKLPCQKLMLRQIEWGENLNLNSVYESSTESLFYIPATKMPIFILFISTWVLFECVFSMWVPLNADRYVRYQLQYLNILSKCQNNHTSCKEEAHT